MIWLCGKRTSNVHKDRTQESRNTKNTYDFFVQEWNFLLPLSLKVLRHKERGAQSFYSGFSLCPPPTRVAPATKVSTSKRKPTVFSRGRSHLNSTNFLKFPKSSARFRAWRHSHSVTPFLILGYCDISEWHVCSAHVNTCVNAAPK